MTTLYDPLSFQERVWLVIKSIPYGYVTSYGEIAQLAGSPRAARQVAKILKNLPQDSTLPWHRVLNSQGIISLKALDFERQRNILIAEGVKVDNLGKVDLSVFRWRQ